MERPVFVLSSGRCGSTLVQRLLNSNPRFAIAGEHGGFLRSLSASYFYPLRLEAAQKNLFGRQQTRESFAKNIRKSGKMVAWENFFGEAEYQEAYRAFIRTLFCYDPALRWGFKEISYAVRDEVPEMLRELFPEAQFIILLRHPVEVIISKATAFPRPRKLAEAALSGDGEAAARHQALLTDYGDNWGKLYRHLLDFAESEPCCHIIRYEDLVTRSTEALTGLEEFLGEGGFDVASILGQPVNVGGGENATRRLATQVVLENWEKITAAVSAPAAQAGYELSREVLTHKGA